MLEYCQVLTSISMVDARGHSFVFVLAKSDEERGIVHAVEDFCKGNAFKPLEPCIEGLLWNLGEQGYDGWASWYASRQGAGATLRDDAFRQSLDQLAAARTGRFAAGTARNNLSTTEWGRGIWDLVAVPEHLLRRFSAEVVPFPKSLPVPIDPCAAKCEPANPMISSANTRWGTEIVVNMPCEFSPMIPPTNAFLDPADRGNPRAERIVALFDWQYSNTSNHLIPPGRVQYAEGQALEIERHLMFYHRGPVAFGTDPTDQE